MAYDQANAAWHHYCQLWQRLEKKLSYGKNTEILAEVEYLRKFKNYKIKTKSTSKKKPSKPARERKRGPGL